MNKFFDTHCHLDRPEFDADRDEVVARARAAGVSLLTLGTDAVSSRRCLELAERYEGVYAAVGIHPNDTGRVPESELAEIRALAAAKGKVLAIGEIGLDYYRDRAPVEVQRRFFLAQLELARELGLPAAIHARAAEEEVLELIAPYARSGVRAVWHCFSAGKKKLRAALERALELGLYLGLGGMITYEDQKPLREVVPLIPDRHLLLDTDSPFIVPRPRAADRNEPAACARIAQELAALRGVSPADIARITTRNAREFLGLPPEEPEQTFAAAIAYPIRDALYLNLTDACTNSCVFCARNRSYVVKGHDLRLEREPEADEVIAALGDTARYSEVVFCGFGEPTMRLETLKAVASELKRRGKPVRLNTNGLANLHHGRDIAPELRGLVDTVSVSLNTADPAQYVALCRPRFGAAAYAGLCDFVKRCLACGIRTVCTVVDVPEVDVEAARERASKLGAEFRVRSHVDAG